MDPSSISPPPPPPAPATNTLSMPTVPAAVPFPEEPNNHPSLALNPNPSHPPYAEMIYTAIEALKEKNGSSKRAIAKYIEQVYKDQLPPTHSALLTHHLNRLKNNGMLQMVKKSYKLPRSASAPPPSPPPAGSSRPRGRPRKAQPQPQAQPVPQAQPAAAGPPGNVNVNVPQQQQNAEPVWAALGLADDPAPQAGSEVKKRPGRPKKDVTAVPAQPGAAVATPGRRGRPPGSKSKKRPGRPPKPVSAAAAAAASGGTKRRPGRPPKNQQQATPVVFAAAADPAAAPALQPVAPVPVPAGEVPVVAASPRPRGRPKKNLDAMAVVPITAAYGSTGRGRGRGRGRGGGVGRGRGRGRGGLLVKPRISTGRSVGRPRKGTISASASQIVVNEDLRRKLDHFQSKVKESLQVLKPHFNHESPVTALAAIQELEELGTMDINAPLRDEFALQQQQLLPPQQLPVQQQQLPPPPPPQQQQLSPQQHMFQQQFPPFNLQPYQQQPQQYQHQPPPAQQQLFHP